MAETILKVSIIEMAKKLLQAGRSIVPSGGGDSGKHPVIHWAEFQQRRANLAELENWQSQYKPAIWGIVTGSISNIAVFDADKPEIIKLFDDAGLKPHVKTARGQHYYFKYPGHFYKTVAGVMPGLDIRADGGFVNCIGSNGKAHYEMLIFPDDASLYDLKQLPETVKQALYNYTQKTGRVSEISGNITEGGRNSTLASLAGSMRSRGISQDVILSALLETNKRVCRPPLSAGEVEAIAKSISRYDAGTPGRNGHREPGQLHADISDYHLTDAGNAEYFTALYGDILRFDHRRQRWLRWHEHYWKPDTDGHIMRLALQAIKTKYKAAWNINDPELRKKISDFAISSEQRGRLDSMLAIGKCLEPIASAGEEWDTDPWLFGVKNGVINLRSGELRDGLKSDNITMQSPVVYNPEAKAPRFMQFLGEIFDGDAELQDWTIKYLGHCLTGDTREQILSIGYGQGGNGKGILISTVNYIMGDYAYSAPFSTFELYERSAIPNDLAALAGRRFVTSSETNEDTRLNEARVKALTGQDTITARFLHSEFFTFQPVAKYFLMVNYRPRVNDTSYGFWRRVRMIPFTRQFIGANMDKTLYSKLITEAPGILNVLIAGCLDWQSDGLDDIPESINAATTDYKADSDPLAEFINDECAETPQGQVNGADFYKAYKKWCEDRGLTAKTDILTATAFGRKMGQKFQKSHERTGTVYHGVGMQCDGFVTGLGSDEDQNGFFSDRLYARGKKVEIDVTTRHRHESLSNPSQDNNLPDCPVCGLNKWSYTPDGKLLCPCGETLKGIPESPH